MLPIDQQLSEQFQQWEERTRGVRVYSHAVAPEPPFVPFLGHYLRPSAEIDDGRRPTMLSSLLQSLWAKPRPSPPEEPEEETAPPVLDREPLVEFPLYLPESFDLRGVEFESFTRSLSVCQEPIAFELVGSSEKIVAQFAVSPTDSGHVRQQLRAFFPDLVAIPATGGLETVWQEAGAVPAVVEFGLAKECVCLLASIHHDPFVALAGVMNELASEECAVFQVVWQCLENKWADNLVRSVTDASGRPFFVNAPELAHFAKTKTTRPLYAAVVRLAACSSDFDRSWEILRLLAGGLRPFGNPTGNELIPLRNDTYPYEAHVDDVVRRQSRRAGMILNADEFLGLVHLPTSAVRSSKFSRQVRKTKPAPAITAHPNGLLLGDNEHAGEHRPVRLSREQRSRHMHIIGASGTGKTTLLYNLIRQDIEAGEGLAVLDPHGDLIERILGIIPPSRIEDVVLLDAGDEEFSVGFNILSAHSDLEKNLLASDLVSVFQRLSTSWGDQMGVVLNNAIRAFLESDRGGTLADVRRFLLEPKFRENLLHTVRDPDIVYYWRKGFTQLTGNKSIGPVMTRLETFLSPKPIRYMVSQPENRLDFGKILDGGKIFLAKLSQGAIGKENSYLLGSLLMAKFQQVAMSRQRQAEASRRDFWLYLDEFHNFITPSTAEILTGARKYHLGLALAHQELRQLQRDSEVASSVLANPYTRICFRVGDQDARTLEHGFSSFEARDLQNLATGEAVCRVERSDYDFNLSVPFPIDPDPSEVADRRDQVIKASQVKYAAPRAIVEATLRKLADTETEVAPPPAQDRRAAAKVAAPTDAAPLPPPTPMVPVLTVPAVSPVPALVPEAVAPEAQPVAIPVNQPVAVPPSVIRSEGHQKLVTDLGRGGSQHKAIQKRLKTAAEELGFRAVIEETIPEGGGSVDLALSRGSERLACEITITNTIDYEVGNVLKCLKAGFQTVAVISVTAEKLARLKGAIAASLGAEAAGHVNYYLPDELVAHLKTMPLPAPESKVPGVPAVRLSHGYKVKRTYAQLTPDEAQAREAVAIKAIADSMRVKR